MHQCFLCFVIFLVSICSAQESPTVLTFEEYTSSVLLQLPDIQLNKLKIYDAEVARLRASKILDYNFEAKLGIFQQTEFTGDVISPFYLSKGLEVGGTLSKTFPEFGGRFELDLTYRQFSVWSFDGANIIDAIFRIPVLTLRFGLPLLRNALGILDRFPMKTAGIDVKIAEWTAEEENAWILANYKKMYMQWYVSDQMRAFLDRAYENALELELLAKAQRSTGYIDDADYQNVQILKLDIDNERINAQNVYTNLQEQIAILTGRSNIMPDPKEWENLTNKMNKQEFTSVPFSETRQALILEFLGQSLKHSLYAYKNSRLPEFNILGSIAMEAYTTNFLPSPEQTILIPTYYAGFQIKYPFGDTESKAQYLELQKKNKELEFFSKKYIKEYIYKTESKIRALKYHRQASANRQGVSTALDARYKAQRRRFDQGRETLASLVDTKNRALKNRIDEADLQLKLIYDYFEYLVLNNQDEASLSYQGVDE